MNCSHRKKIRFKDLKSNTKTKTSLNQLLATLTIKVVINFKTKINP